MKPEERARKMIDDLLGQAGWTVQDMVDLNLSASLGVAVREFPLSAGFADYLLFVNEEPVGVIEAKKVGQTLIGVEEQSAKYLTNLPAILATEREQLAFSYETTGIETRFTNHLDPEPRSRRVFAFHQPETLAAWLAQAPIDIPNEQNETMRARIKRLPPLLTAQLRNCQEEVKAVLIYALNCVAMCVWRTHITYKRLGNLSASLPRRYKSGTVRASLLLIGPRNPTDATIHTINTLSIED